jgi:hypothetical protein
VIEGKYTIPQTRVQQKDMLGEHTPINEEKNIKASLTLQKYEM